MIRLAGLSTHLQSQLNDADWTTKSEIVRALIQRIEIGPTKVAVVLRLPTEASARLWSRLWSHCPECEVPAKRHVLAARPVRLHRSLRSSQIRQIQSGERIDLCYNASDIAAGWRRDVRGLEFRLPDNVIPDPVSCRRKRQPYRTAHLARQFHTSAVLIRPEMPVKKPAVSIDPNSGG